MRWSNTLILRIRDRYFIGLDVGGTFIRGTIIDVEDNLRYNVKDVGANPAVVPREK